MTNEECPSSVFIFYLKRWHVTKNSHGDLESVSKEDHPIDCPLEIDVTPFCSTNIRSPPTIRSLEDWPNLKDLLKQREMLVHDNSSTIEAKRARREEKPLAIAENEESSHTHGNYRLFAVINHHGGSSDVGRISSSPSPSPPVTHPFQDITLPPSTTPKVPLGGPTTTHRSASVQNITF